MAIGTSDGEYYEDRFDYLTRSYQQAGNEEDQGREQVPLYRGGKDVTPKEKPKPPLAPEGGPKGIHSDMNINYDHHVPLIASAIVGDDGSMQGMAVDHRLKGIIPDHYLPLLYLHEATELPWMQDYMDDGMKPGEAYDKGHDYATARESAAARGYAVRNGLDPNAYHEGYKQFFRDAAGITGQPSGVDRHPRAHTTLYGLDETEDAIQKKHAELLSKNPLAVFAGVQGEHGGAVEAKFTKAWGMMKDPNNTPEDIHKATGWFFDETQKKWKYEIPDTGAWLKAEGLGYNIEPNKEHPEGRVGINKPWPEGDMDAKEFSKAIDQSFDRSVKLSDILEHPELFKTYPWMKNIDVKQTSVGDALSGVRGSYNPSANTMRLTPGNPTQVMSTMLHEIQHAIQTYEGFEQGGNKQEFLPEQVKDIDDRLKPLGMELDEDLKKIGTNLKEMTEIVSKANSPIRSKYLTDNEKLKMRTLQEEFPDLWKMVTQHHYIKKGIEELDDKAYAKYRTLAGEVESRNVQRRFMDPAMKEQHPFKTEDTSEKGKVYRGTSQGYLLPEHMQPGHGLLQIDPGVKQ